MTTTDPLDERVRRCTGTDLRDPRRAATAARLLGEVLSRPTWSLHRHVHLVSAFEDARALAPIETVLTVGCGLGLSEQFLAVANPDVHFTLTDVDPKRIELASRSARAHGITNIEVRLLDLLDEPGDDRFDLVTGIEVLEHIEDDRLAAAHARVLASRFVYQLLPGCSETALDDPDRIRRAFEAHEHFRPGYTHRTLGELFEGAPVLWMRRCYYAPEAQQLRAELASAGRAERRRRAASFVGRALVDVRDDPDARSAGIEVLVAVDELPSSTPERPRWDDRPMPRCPSARLARGQVERVAAAVDRRVFRRR